MSNESNHEANQLLVPADVVPTVRRRVDWSGVTSLAIALVGAGPAGWAAAGSSRAQRHAARSFSPP